MKKKILFSLLFIFFGVARAQEPSFGISAGLAFTFGTTVNRLGVHFSGYGLYNYAQVNVSVKGYYNFQSLALKQKTPELQLGLAGQFGFVRVDSSSNPFIGLPENNMSYDYSVGYGYIHYFDKQNTSQGAGFINANIKQFNIITENDLFGNLLNQTDRYRTAAALIEYRHNLTKVGLNVLLWTADFGDCGTERTKRYARARFGHYIDDGNRDRSTTLGILSIQAKQWLPYQQELKVDMGINSERVRHVVQNELIHDQPFFPEKIIRRKPPHIPMYTEEGDQFFFLKGQEVKRPNFHFNFGLNTMTFY